MTLPTSFLRDGFVGPEQIRPKRRRLLIGTDGPTDSGKTEFLLSCPGPGLIVCLDRNYEAVLDNPHPPESRRGDFAFRHIQVPLAGTMTQEGFLKYWRDFYEEYKKMLANPDALTAAVDGDSDSWELQRLATFGRLEKVPPIKYTEANAARRAMIARAWDSGKTVIFTNKVKKVYAKNAEGIEEATGEHERQGFSDQDYLVQVQLRHFCRDGQFGIRVTKCKHDTSLVGLELCGADCNFPSLVQSLYPDLPLSAWGY